MHLSITLTVKWGKGFSLNLMFLKLLILPTLQHTFQNSLKVWSIPLWRKVGRKFNLYQIRLQMFYSSLYLFPEASNSHSFLNCKATMNINKLISNKVSSNKKCACIFRTLYEEKYKRDRWKFKTVLNCTLIITGECKRRAKLANSIIMLTNVTKPH